MPFRKTVIQDLPVIPGLADPIDLQAILERAIAAIAAEKAALKPGATQTPISANCMWNSDNCDPANFTVPAGASVTFWAEGTWLTHPHGPDGGPWNGPAGNGVPNQGAYPCSGPESCMVIFTGEAVPPAPKVGATVWGWFEHDDQMFNYTNGNAYPVTIYFAANDDTSNNCQNYNDNKGTITVYSAPKPVDDATIVKWSGIL